jgi:hypothetical protein
MGVVCAVRDGGRCVTVSAQSGESFEFALSPATAKFVLAGDAHGADMELADVAQGA